MLPARAELLELAFTRPGTDQANLEWLMHEHLLPRCQRLTLCIERADCLHRQRYETNFFTLLRSFVEQSKREAPWSRLRLLLTLATEPVLLLDTIDHSGLFRDANPIELQPLTPAQVAEMARPYGIAANDPGLGAVSERCGGYPFLVRCPLYQDALPEQAPLHTVSLVVAVSRVVRVITVPGGCASPVRSPDPSQGSLPICRAPALIGRVSHPQDDTPSFKVSSFSFPLGPAFPGRTTLTCLAAGPDGLWCAGSGRGASYYLSATLNWHESALGCCWVGDTGQTLGSL